MHIPGYLVLSLALTALATGCVGIPETYTSTDRIVSNRGDPATLTKIHLDSNVYTLVAGSDAVWLGPDMEPLFGNTNILRVDPSEHRVAAIIPTRGNFFLTMAIGEDAVWAPSSGRLYRIGRNRDEIVAEIPLFGYSEGIAVGEGAVWVGHGGKVSRVDTNSNSVVAEISTGRNTWDRIAAGEGSVWVLKMSDGVVYRIDPLKNEVVAGIQLGPPYTDNFYSILQRRGVWHGLAELGWASQTAYWVPYKSIAAGEGAVWVTRGAERESAVLRIDPRSNKLVAEISLPGDPESVTTHAGYVWVSDGSKLVRVNPDSNKVDDVITIPSGRDCPTAHGTIAAAGDSLWFLQSTRPERPTNEACLWRVEFD